MRIAINTLSLNKTKAGMGNYIYHLIHNLALLDKKNHYHIFVSDRNKKFFKLKQENFRVINIGKIVTKKCARLIWEQLFLPAYIKKHRIDILHSPGFVLPFLSRTKNILTIADMTFITHPKVHTLLKRMYFGFLMPYSIKKADKVIAISESTRRDILGTVKVDPEKIGVTHLAVGRKFKALNKEKCRKHIKDKYKIDSPFVLFVGMIEPRKNLKRIFHAFTQLKEDTKMPHKLVVVGKKGWMYKELFNMVKELGIKKEITFTGYVPDEELVRFYNAADTFVYTCLYEGFGIPILEAMACGCPVITSNISSMPEVAGDAAILVNPQKTGEIACAMKKIINDKELQKRMQRKSRLQCSKFSWKQTASKTLLFYNETVKKLDTKKMGATG